LNLGQDWLIFLIAVVVGIVGALVAHFFQKLAIGVAGFFGGALIASSLLPLLTIQGRGWDWLLLLAGGVIGIILVYAVFEWALIILSSAAGALLIVDGFKLAGLTAIIVGTLLFAVGIIFQFGLRRRDRSRSS